MASRAAENIDDDAVRRAVTLMSEALVLLDSVECKSKGAALLDHAVHTLIADYAGRGNGLYALN